MNIAILCLDESPTVDDSTIQNLLAVNGSNVFVYCKNSQNLTQNSQIKYVDIPVEYDTLSKMHNYVVKDQVSKGYAGFLHVIENNVLIKTDPTTFIDDLVKLMPAIDLNVWFSTITDKMNYVFSRYNPRMVIEFDEPKWQKFGLDGVVFTSHSNIAWIVYNMANYNEKEYLFDEQFSIRMFMIVEFLARRKALNNNNDSLCLMNMYPTVKSEHNAFQLKSDYNENVKNELLKTENDNFAKMKLNIAPDNLIDSVLERLYIKFLKK